MRKFLSISPATKLHFEPKEALPSFLSKTPRYVIITDTNVEPLFGQTVLQTLLSKGFDALLIVIPAGEEHKTRGVKEEIENRMLLEKCSRDTAIIALGGGVILDIAGFVAATYCRGIPLISLPTTLLAMVDASIGGKTGVNTSHGKNLIGAFHNPSLVLIDPTFLKPLPQKEWKNGYAEVIKYGLIAKEDLFYSLEAPLDLIIYESLLIKKTTVENDPHEKGLRRILNFGHTIGHAIEALLHYEIGHGEAVAMGMAFESLLSVQLGYLNETAFHEILSLLERTAFALDLLERIPFSDLMRAMMLDKKSLKNAPRFVLLEKIGGVVPFHGNYCREVDPKQIQRAYESFTKERCGRSIPCRT